VHALSDTIRRHGASKRCFPYFRKTSLLPFFIVDKFMRIVIQRVSEAAVIIDGQTFSRIGRGLVILAGFEQADTPASIDRLCAKIVNMRIFSDKEGKMNLSVKDVSGALMAVSQFTLYAATRKGNRPSFIRAAPPEISRPLYDAFVRKLEEISGTPVATGVFGADMKIALINDGPVTIVMDTQHSESSGFDEGMRNK
jgi:D-tyrosyl-tRNA(Tyr) deacylase